MDNKDFLQIFQAMKVNEMSYSLKEIKNRSASTAASDDFQKKYCALVYEAHEELKMIEHYFERFPLWSALRLLGLETGLRARGDYADIAYGDLKVLESHVPTDPVAFPFKWRLIYPIDQAEIDSLEFKKLLSETLLGIQQAIEKYAKKFKSEFKIAKATIELLKIARKKFMCRELKSKYDEMPRSWWGGGQEREKLKVQIQASEAESKNFEQEAVRIVQEFSSGRRIENLSVVKDAKDFDQPSAPTFLKMENGSIHFECRYCSQPLEIDEAGGGIEIKCPECGECQKVPTPRKARSRPNQ